MDVRHLRLLRELADRGSVTAVAEATHRTASAVSQQLRTAQREFGMRLVEPDGRGVRLTEAGVLLAAGGAEVDAAIAAVQARWDAYREEPGGEVSIVVFPSAAALLMPDVLADADDMGISVRVVDRDPAESEFAGLTADFDIVIAHSLTGPCLVATAGMAVHELVTEPLDIAMSASHPLARRSRLTPADVKDASWIGVPEGYPFDLVLTSIAQLVGHQLTVRQRVRDNRVIESLVTAGDCLAVLPRFTTRSGAGLVLREITGVPARRYLSAVMRPDVANRRAVQAVLESVKRTAASVSLGPVSNRTWPA
ncbi:DNA-binding transcriptional LysR family regulator [Stackebrandtia endophytica]|uniref:DNA-binding transcriptional LysR family regulator n=1 Tax=Stackebrandtia endophytica TaxID=1496996 RepID=A0A543AY31_9ACTN|nr:LysR family transcriptional regulator [Stackebrandtia endophytica]TQL77484.1 DNA-binding transcriptional LysR family regulator [Stackebrandtia endophytica]